MLQKHIDKFFKNLVIKELEKTICLDDKIVDVDNVFFNSLNFYVMVINIFHKETNEFISNFLTIIKRCKNNYNCLYIENFLTTVKNTYIFDFVDTFNTIHIPECEKILDIDISNDHRFILIAYIDKYKKNKLCIFEFIEDGDEKLLTIHNIKLTKTKSKEIRCLFNDIFPSISFTVVGFDPNIHVAKYKFNISENKFILVSGKTIDHKFDKDRSIDDISLNYF